MMKLKSLAIKNKVVLIGVLAGAIGGYLYYYFIGCTTGNCAITSNPVISTLYGSLMGGLLMKTFEKNKNKTEQ